MRTARALHAHRTPRTRTRPAVQVVHTAENTYIVMELLSGGELFNRIVDKGCYPEKEAAELFAQICISLDYLHSRDIVRRLPPTTRTHAQENLLH